MPFIYSSSTFGGGEEGDRKTMPTFTKPGCSYISQSDYRSTVCKLSMILSHTPLKKKKKIPFQGKLESLAFNHASGCVGH